MPASDMILRPVGIIQSPLKARKDAPRQGGAVAPDAWILIDSALSPALEGLVVGREIIVITWLHRAERGTLQVYPRQDLSSPIKGVFATRSPDRPNPLGLHPVTILEIEGNRLKVGPIEAIDGTPVVDIKPAPRPV
jgi:tRNA-Thr(GGU) m(6)t(6)A37 methyltransferase TsaA